MQGKVKDPSRPEDVFAKMQYVKETFNKSEQVVIHYWEVIETGIRDGFKFK